MKRILINATQPEELRVATVDGQRLYNLDIEGPSREQRKANVYKGRITRVEPSLEAAFVDYGASRHGFLPLKEVARSYFINEPAQGKINIKEVLKEGQELIVQVDKEERGNKGAALTTFISLAGRFLVLMPNNPRAGGVSRRIEGDDRGELREAMADVNIPAGMGAIARTAGVGRSAEELQWDLDYLVQVWEAIEKAGERKAPFLIYQESNVIIRALRDYLRQDIGEVIIDDKDIYRQAEEFITQVMPQNLSKLKLYEDRIPLFSRFQIESQIETAFSREVRLPSGGALVIDRTEALTSIDINSARATGGGDIEETALNTNLEAAEEIMRQLRLRDLGGLIVIDFIDMSSNQAQRKVENSLHEAAKADRARIQIGRISRFGLMEMSRQRLRPSLSESSHIPCPRCHGQGSIRDVESLALSVLRLLEEEALKEKTGRVIAHLPIAVATYLLNEKRAIMSEFESRCKVAITVIPNADLEVPHYELTRIRADELKTSESRSAPSYTLEPEANKETLEELPGLNRDAIPRETAAVAQIVPKAPPVMPAAPVAAEAAPAVQGPGALYRLWKAIIGLFSSGEPRQQKEAGKSTRSSKDDKQGRSSQGSGQRSRQGGSQSSNQSSGETSGRRNSRGGRSQASSSNDGNGNRRGRSGNQQRGQKRDDNRGSQQGGGRNQRRRGSQNAGTDKAASDTTQQSGSNDDNRNAAPAVAEQGSGPQQSSGNEPNRNDGGENGSGNRRRRGRRGGRGRNRQNAQDGGDTQRNAADGASSGNEGSTADNTRNPDREAGRRPQQSPSASRESSAAASTDSSSSSSAGADSPASPIRESAPSATSNSRPASGTSDTPTVKQDSVSTDARPAPSAPASQPKPEPKPAPASTAASTPASTSAPTSGVQRLYSPPGSVSSEPRREPAAKSPTQSASDKPAPSASKPSTDGQTSEKPKKPAATEPGQTASLDL